MLLKKLFKCLTLYYVNCLLRGDLELGVFISYFFHGKCQSLHCLTFFLCRYSPVGRSFYSPNLGRRQQLGEGLESWRGFYQSIRPTQMGLSLNIG
jgi:hypothetical protein